MDLAQNPFYILNATPRDNKRRIMELAEDHSLLIDSNHCAQALADLTNPRKRLSLEIAWMPGPNMGSENLTRWLSKPVQAIPPSSVLKLLSPLSRTNILASGLKRLINHNANDVAKWILELASAFEEIDPEQTCSIINEERIISGFPEVNDLSMVEAEIQERRRYYLQVIKSALDALSTEELLKTVSLVVETATDNGKIHGQILIDALLDSYEVEAQAFLKNEKQNIEVLVEKLNATADSGRPDSVLTPMVQQIIQVVKNWNIVAQPIQVSKKSRGLDHDASHRIAGLVRGLAIHMFNEHDKLNFSQQLINMLQEVFAELGEVAERTTEDANALGDIADQRFTYTEVARIKDLSEQIKADVDDARPDSYLSPKVSRLCQFIKNWDIDPEHDASQHAARLVRDLAIHMFNKHDELDFSQQLIKALLDVFAGAGEISERIMEDAKALREISSNRDNLASQFKEFNLNGNSFSYKGKTYSSNNIRHIGLYRAITSHKVNFIETGKTEEVHIYLTMNGGQEVRISVDEQGFFFKKDKSSQIKTLVEFYSYLSYITFDRRVDFYESQIKSNGCFIYDRCSFYPNDKIVFMGREFSLESTSFLRGYGYVEIRKKDYGILDKIKREVSLSKIPQFSTIVDTDVIFHLLDKHFSLRWES
jgi:hypothetical protein